MWHNAHIWGKSEEILPVLKIPVSEDVGELSTATVGFASFERRWIGKGEEICGYLVDIGRYMRSIASRGKSGKGQSKRFKLLLKKKNNQPWSLDPKNFPECFLCCERGLWTSYKNLCNLHQCHSSSFTLWLQLYFSPPWLSDSVGNMLFTNIAFVVLCLASGSLAAPLICDNVQPANQMNHSHFYGDWNLIAASVKVQRTLMPLIDNDSFTLHYNNATFLTMGRYGSQCSSTRYNVTMEGADFTTTNRFVGVHGNIFSSSNCPDCFMARIFMHSRHFALEHLCMFSRREEVKPEELQDFKSLAQCLKFPKYVVMDPSKERCPPPEDFYNSNWE